MHQGPHVGHLHRRWLVMALKQSGQVLHLRIKRKGASAGPRAGRLPGRQRDRAGNNRRSRGSNPAPAYLGVQVPPPPGMVCKQALHVLVQVTPLASRVAALPASGGGGGPGIRPLLWLLGLLVHLRVVPSGVAEKPRQQGTTSHGSFDGRFPTFSARGPREASKNLWPASTM